MSDYNEWLAKFEFPDTPENRRLHTALSRNAAGRIDVSNDHEIVGSRYIDWLIKTDRDDSEESFSAYQDYVRFTINGGGLPKRSDVINDEKAAGILANHMKLRKWLYNVSIAGLAVYTTWQGWEAINVGAIDNLLQAVFGLVGVGVTATARSNVR